jgi:hypothetical protein
MGTGHQVVPSVALEGAFVLDFNQRFTVTRAERWNAFVRVAELARRTGSSGGRAPQFRPAECLRLQPAELALSPNGSPSGTPRPAPAAA